MTIPRLFRISKLLRNYPAWDFDQRLQSAIDYTGIFLPGENDKNKLEIITLHKPGITDFASARNLLLKQSKSDWILFLDSDEKLSDELKKEISDLDGTGYMGFLSNEKLYFWVKNR